MCPNQIKTQETLVVALAFHQINVVYVLSQLPTFQTKNPTSLIVKEINHSIMIH